jgi:hypothetical protein
VREWSRPGRCWGGFFMREYWDYRMRFGLRAALIALTLIAAALGLSTIRGCQFIRTDSTTSNSIGINVAIWLFCLLIAWRGIHIYRRS